MVFHVSDPRARLHEKLDRHDKPQTHNSRCRRDESTTWRKLSGPTATATLSRYTLSHCVFHDLEGCRKRIALHPPKRPCSTNLFSSQKGVSHFELPLGRCRGTRGYRSYTVRLSRCSGPLREEGGTQEEETVILETGVPYKSSTCIQTGDCSGAPNPYNVSEKYWRYTSNCTAVRPPFVTLCLAGF